MGPHPHPRIGPATLLALAGALPVLLLAQSAVAQGAPGAYDEVPVRNGGVLSGRVTYHGPEPEPAELLITRDFEVCGMGVRKRREVDVTDDGGLRAVVVFIEGVEAGKGWPEAPDGYLLDQLECFFEPYIQIVPRGAELEIVNSDPILHNVHGYELVDDGRRRTLFNLAQPDESVVTRSVRTRLSRRVGLECDAHDFMLGWIFAADNPYAVVVDSLGAFSLPDVPPGSYTVGAWHPFLGVREQQVTVAPGGTMEVDFVFAAE